MRPRTKPRPPVALTGTPGTGKSTVAALLPPTVRRAEVGELARGRRAAQGRGRELFVDLSRLRRSLAQAPAELDVLVGHLAHLLPVREAIVLRCRPVELARRLARARRGDRAQRQANVVCEATDAIVAEALRAGCRVYEIDTTGRTPRDVALEVARRVDHGGPGRVGTVDWLADPAVTEQLLERAR